MIVLPIVFVTSAVLFALLFVELDGLVLLAALLLFVFVIPMTFVWLTVPVVVVRLVVLVQVVFVLMVEFVESTAVFAESMVLVQPIPFVQSVALFVRLTVAALLVPPAAFSLPAVLESFGLLAALLFALLDRFVLQLQAVFVSPVAIPSSVAFEWLNEAVSRRRAVEVSTAIAQSKTLDTPVASVSSAKSFLPRYFLFPFPIDAVFQVAFVPPVVASYVGFWKEREEEKKMGRS